MRLVPRRVGVVVVLLVGLLSPGVVEAADDDRTCRRGDRGRLLGVGRVASHPTAADARAYFEEWAEFYRDYSSSRPTCRPTSTTGSTATS
jgi:hypothetical protein